MNGLEWLALAFRLFSHFMMCETIKLPWTKKRKQEIYKISKIRKNKEETQIWNQYFLNILPLLLVNCVFLLSHTCYTHEIIRADKSASDKWWIVMKYHVNHEPIRCLFIVGLYSPKLRRYDWYDSMDSHFLGLETCVIEYQCICNNNNQTYSAYGNGNELARWRTHNWIDMFRYYVK